MKFGTHILQSEVSNNHNNNKPQQQHEKDNQKVFECLKNTVHKTQPQINTKHMIQSKIWNLEYTH